MLEKLINSYKPDILDCLSHLSSDEVFTPPLIVNEILDSLPAHLWLNPNARFLDPCTKSGVFLREIAKRLLIGLQDEIPDESMRREHIFTNMLYGISITELTSLVARRTLYYTKNPASTESVANFSNKEGNIYYQRTVHDYEKGKCKYCGLPENSLDRGENRENYAYAFIHGIGERIFNMKFDVIVGNPPYQLQDAGESTGYSPIYQLFVEQAIKLNPSYLSMIIPSRWFSGGKGLDSFRENMLNDRRISHLVDYHDAADCFPGVEIKGGVCYFLWNSAYNGKCNITSVLSGTRLPSSKRYLDEFQKFVRLNDQVEVLRKVAKQQEETIEKYVSSQKPFGFRTNFKDFQETKFDGAVKIYAKDKIGWLARNKVAQNVEWIDKWKVLISRSYNGGYKYPHQIINKPIVAEPGSICTETYIILRICNDQKEAELFAKYVKSKFFRFLVWCLKVSQDNPKDRFSFVPNLELNQEWDDKKLYRKYDLTDSEIEFIENNIREI